MKKKKDRMLEVNTKFFPIRLVAHKKDSVELTLEVENKHSDALWVEADVSVPPELSLSRDKDLTVGRVRVGIIPSQQGGMAKCSIFSGVKTPPSLYTLTITVYGYGRKGDVLAKKQFQTSLRVESIGKI